MSEGYTDMLIQSLKKHFPARFPEWLNSGVLFSWGLYVILHPQLFTNPATGLLFSGMAAMTWGLPYDPSVLWGLTGILVGGIRACALFINGAFSRTPLIRLISSFVSAFVWTQVVTGLMKVGVPNTGLIVYSWLVVADLASAYRAGIDVVYAEQHRRNASREIGGGAFAHSSRIIA